MTESENPKNCKCSMNDGEQDMYMSDGDLFIYDIDDGYYRYEVNYCPMCGMKVHKDTEIKELIEGIHYGSDGKEWIVKKESLNQNVIKMDGILETREFAGFFYK